MVAEHRAEHQSQWAAMVSIAAKIGCTAETLRRWVRQKERDTGVREGLSTAEMDRIKALEREFECTAQTITNWVGQSARDAGKPLPGKEGLSTAEREELTRLRRQVRQLQMERDILSKATAWFAWRVEKTFTLSSNS